MHTNTRNTIRFCTVSTVYNKSAPPPSSGPPSSPALPPLRTSPQSRTSHARCSSASGPPAT
eukprot:399292-Prymnesium_polylepis.1